MALGLQRKDPAWADQDVVDVPVPERYVVENLPSVADKALENLADRPFSLRPGDPAINDGAVRAIEPQHADDRERLDQHESDAVQPQSESGSNGNHHQSQQEDQRANGQPSGGAPRVLPSVARRGRGFDAHAARIGPKRRTLEPSALLPPPTRTNSLVARRARFLVGDVYAMRYTSPMAKTVPVREFRSNLSQLLSDVADRRDHVLVTRNGRPAAALVPIDEYDALEETAEILSDSETLAAIEVGLAELARDETVTLADLGSELAERRRSG
jgi:antitoxin YefM